MKPDESIDVVLNALRTSDPPQGYEGRIQQALSAASQEPHSGFILSSRHPERSVVKSAGLLSFPSTKMPWSAVCVLAGAAVLIITFAVRIPRGSHPVHPRSTLAVAREETLPLQLSSPLRATKTTAPRVTRHTLKSAQKSSALLQPSHEEIAVLTHEYIPEPPLPLTEQERLVIRMMHRDNSPQLAEYTPDARARRLHEDAEEYRKYFAAQPLDGQPLYVQPIYHQKIFGGSQ